MPGTRSLEQVENEMLAAEAELSAMSGYEEKYPQHYANIEADYNRLRDEYFQLKQEYDEAGEQFMSPAPYPKPISWEIPWCGEDAIHEPSPAEHYDDERCQSLPIAGEGEKVCLIDPDPDGTQRENELKGIPHVQLVGTASVAVDPYEIPAASNARNIKAQGGRIIDVSPAIVDKLQAVADEIRSKGGILSNGGGYTNLTRDPDAQGRISKSLHLTGLAVDLFQLMATLNPETDRMVITEVSAPAQPGNRTDRIRHHVYCRSTDSSIPESTLSALVFEPGGNGKIKTQSVTGRFISVTQAFANHGFEGIAARGKWLEPGGMNWDNRPEMEWWHFQYTKHLMTGKTTFGELLLQLHPYYKLRNSGPWVHRHSVWNGSSFG
jgi:hypothetical protein